MDFKDLKKDGVYTYSQVSESGLKSVLGRSSYADTTPEKKRAREERLKKDVDIVRSHIGKVFKVHEKKNIVPLSKYYVTNEKSNARITFVEDNVSVTIDDEMFSGVKFSEYGGEIGAGRRRRKTRARKTRKVRKTRRHH